MGAYIINVPDTVDTIIYVNIGDVYDGKTYIASQRVEDLTPYTEPDLEQARKEAYEKGFHEGYGRYINKSYEDGLNGAWEVARKIWEYDTTTLREIFGEGIMRMDYFMRFTASEAIEKIRQYEQRQEEDGLRHNIQTIVDQCGYSLDEIAEVLAKMKETDNG